MPRLQSHILSYKLLSGDATSDHTFELARVLRDLGSHVELFSNHHVGELPADIEPSVRQLHYADYQPGADLTILQYPAWFPLAERFRARGGAKIFWYHGVTPPDLWHTDDGRDRLELSQVRTELACYAHLAVAASPFTAQELRNHLAASTAVKPSGAGYPADRVRVVPLGIDIPAFSTRPDHRLLAELRQRWRLCGKQVLLCVGRVVGNKRIDLAIEALALLSPTQPDLHLLVVGENRDGSVTRQLTNKLQTLARRMGVEERVSFTGRVPSVAPYYHLATLFLQTSQHEGFGVPLVEAMASRVPVVASASGAMPWLLNADVRPEDAAGRIFAEGNAHDLAQHIDQILTDATLRQQLIERGEKRAKEFDRNIFRVRAALVICEALEMSRNRIAPSLEPPSSGSLDLPVDVVLRSYRVRSRIPLVGHFLSRFRSVTTEHVKEAYFDQIVERQVDFNRRFADALQALEVEMSELQGK